MTDLDDLKTIAGNTDNWDGKKDILNWAVSEITRLKAKLVETQEPVAIVSVSPSRQISITNPDGTFFDVSKHIGKILYTKPPAREWRNLSDDEIDAIFPLGDDADVLDVARGIEAKLREKNND